MRSDVELGDEIAPPQELTPQSASASRGNGQVDEAQNALIRPLQRGPVLRGEETRGAVHLVGDHQDLLVEVEAGPALGGE